MAKVLSRRCESRLEVEKFWPQLTFISGKRNRMTTVAFEKLLLKISSFSNDRPITDAFLYGPFPGHLDQVRIVFDAMGARAALGGGDHVTPVTRTEVDDVILGVTFAMSRSFATMTAGLAPQTHPARPARPGQNISSFAARRMP